MGDPLLAFETHIDFAALAAEVDEWSPVRRARWQVVCRFPSRSCYAPVSQAGEHLSGEQMEYQGLVRMNSRVSAARAIRPAFRSVPRCDLREPHQEGRDSGDARGDRAAFAQTRLHRPRRSCHRRYPGARTAAELQPGRTRRSFGRTPVGRLEAGEAVAKKPGRRLDPETRQEPPRLRPPIYIDKRYRLIRKIEAGTAVAHNS